MQIVFLDRNTIGEDIDVTLFQQFGKLTIYSFTEEEHVAERISDADIIITNKGRLNAATLKDAHPRLICLTATGVDNVDLSYCAGKGIAVCNMRGYSTESVVQHTFAMLFSLMEHIPLYNDYTQTRRYINDASFRHLSWTFHEISGKNFGIVGMGAIGTRVAEVADAFGCKVYYWSSTDQDRNTSYTRLDFNTLLETCDILSIHSPLTPKTRHLFGTEQFRRMKRDAVLINAGRGDIIVEEDLAAAIETGLIGGAAVDVLSKEPMAKENPLARILGNPRFMLTPHIAWAAVEARQRCMQEVFYNIEAFLNGDTRNRVDTIPPLIL